MHELGNLIRPSRLSLLLAFVLLFVAPTADAANCKQQSANCPCSCASVIDLYGIGQFQFNTTGTMGLVKTTDEQVASGVCAAWYQSTAFEAFGTHPVLGDISIQLDPSRQPPDGALINTVPFEDFPADHDVFAYALVSMTGLPGTVLRTTEPLHLRGEGVNSFGEGLLESYFLAQPVDLEDVESPGLIRGRLLSADIQIGGSP